jgi:hypothetical protein
LKKQAKNQQAKAARQKNQITAAKGAGRRVVWPTCRQQKRFSQGRERRPRRFKGLALGGLFGLASDTLGKTKVFTWKTKIRWRLGRLFPRFDDQN